MRSPVIAASGTYGFGREYGKYIPLSELGGISVKGLTLTPRQGNPPPRIAETPSGILNSVGLQNPGVHAFIRDELPFLKAHPGLAVFANAAGSTVEEYGEMAAILSETDVDGIEANVSCPNVKCGGAAFGTDPDVLARVVRCMRRQCKKPLIVKLSPNVTAIALMARIAEAEGADGVSLINTLMGMAVDIRTKKPILGNNAGGLSGPAVKPIALKMVFDVSRAVSIPVIGMGGIVTGEDAIAFFLCGASAVMVGTGNFTDPFCCKKVTDEIADFMDSNGYTQVSDMVGKLELN